MNSKKIHEKYKPKIPNKIGKNFKEAYKNSNLPKII